MNIHLTDELQAFVEERVASGRYNTAAEVIREGLRVLQEREERKELLEKVILLGLSAEEEAKLAPGALDRVRATIRASIKKGVAELERGEGADGEEFFADLLGDKIDQ